MRIVGRRVTQDRKSARVALGMLRYCLPMPKPKLDEVVAANREPVVSRVKAIVTLLGLCAASFVTGCEGDKKTTVATASTSTAAYAADATLPPPPSPTTAEIIPKTIAAAVDAWNAHDPAKVAASYQTTATLTLPGQPDIEGRDAISAQAKDNFIACPNFKVAVTKTFIHENTAAFEWVVTGTNDGSVMGQKPSGRQMGVSGASIVTVDGDGLIKEERRYVDLPTIMSQLDPKAKTGTFRAPLALPTAPTETRVATETPDDVKTIDAAKMIYAAFDSKSETSLLAVVTDNTIIDDRTRSTIFTGTKGATDDANGLWKTFPDFRLTHAVQFADGDVVITEGVLNGTQSGPMGPIKATNKPVTFHFVDVLQIKDGKIARVDSFGDNAEILQAIGPLPK